VQLDLLVVASPTMALGTLLRQRLLLGSMCHIFFDVLELLNKDKRRVIESYGFGSLLLSDKCQIPIPFARWLVDRVNIDSWDIVLKKKSIPITP
jgi:hypothetical protein